MRPRSLFWTFAGVFLLVLVIATAAQVVALVAVIRPMSEANARGRAGAAVAAAARRIPDLQVTDERGVARVLREEHVPDGTVELVWFPIGGRMVFERPLPPPLPRQILGLAMRSGLVPEGARPLPPPPFGGPPGGMPGGEGRPRAGRPGEPPLAEDGRGGAFDGPPADEAGPYGPPPGADAPPFGTRPDLVLLASTPVVREGRPLGIVAAVGRAGGGGVWGDPGVRALLLFMPFAVLAACAAGLLMVRIVVRRLRALEGVARRVTEGDLEARVGATGSDEIGRLEADFNRMTERLAAARDALARTDGQRRRLLADITHELATPLTSIRGYVETLIDPAVPKSEEERATYLADVLDEAKRLDLLITDLLELARLEAGAQPLARERLDWRALCRNTARRFESRFRDAGLRLAWDDAAGEAWIDADGRRMEQVVENLLVNALRYVPRGGTVAVALADADGNGRHRLTVSDDGPGIAPSDLPHLFERFYRARSVRDAGGTGLGLAIVQEIVERHGGSVRAERREPRGATFVVEIPAAR